GSVLAAVDRHREALAVLDEARATLVGISEPSIDRVRPQGWAGIDLITPGRVANLILEQRGRSLAALGEVTEGLDLLYQARAEAIELGLLNRAAESWLWETSVLLEAGRLEEAVACYRAGSAYAADHGLSSRYIQFFGADALFALGRWPEAAEVLDSADLDPPRVEAPFLDGRRAQIDVAQGRLDEGARLVGRHQQLIAQSLIPTILSPFACAEAELALWKGDASTAAALTMDMLPRLEAAPDVWVGHLGPVYALAIRAHADLAVLGRSTRIAVGAETAAAAADILERMRRLARRLAVESPVYG